MRLKLYLSLALFLIVGVVVVRLSLFTVDRTEFVYLTQFGRPVAVYDGATEADAGLHWKWPWPIQSVQSFDRRLQYLDLPGAELLTRDPRRATIDKTLTIDAYVCWRIPDRVSLDRFIRAVGTVQGARAVLAQRINSELGAAIGQMELDDLISVGVGGALPGMTASTVGLLGGPLGQGPLLSAAALGGIRDKVDLKREQLRQRLLDGSGPSGGLSLRQVMREEYGIEVVDLRLRRLNHPPMVQDAIFRRIESERNKKVADYESEGERLAADIRSNSEKRVTEMRAEAEARSIQLRGQAETAADRIRNEAARLDPQFYTFLRKLDDYKRFLGDNKTMLLLSTHRELFDSLFKAPGSDPKDTKPMNKGEK
jgi:membrane protease subunit HflC